MAKTIQVRDVDDDTHRVLTARAEAAGLSLSQYLRREFRWMVGQPTVAEVLDRAERRPIAVDADHDLLHRIRWAIAPGIGCVGSVGGRKVGAAVRVRVVDDPGSHIVVESPIQCQQVAV